MEMKIVEVTVIPIEEINTFNTVMEGINPGSFYEITEDGGEVEGYTWILQAAQKK